MPTQPRNYSIKTVTINPPWLIDALNSDNVSGGTGFPMRSRIASVAESYARVPLVFRAVRVRGNSLLTVPRHLYEWKENQKPEDRKEVSWMFPVDLDWLLWRTQAALLMAGGSPIVKKRNELRRAANGPVQDLEWLNPFTVTVRWDSQLGKRVYTQAGQMLVGGQTRTWTDDDMVFIREYAPMDDIGFGVAPAAVAFQSARVAFSIQQMAAVFFENGAMPVSLLTTASPLDPDERDRIQGFFGRITSGVRNAFRTLAVSGDIKFQTTQNRMKDLAVPDLSDQARKDIARAFGMPVTLLDSDETYATASEHIRFYTTETVVPDAVTIASG
jgi:phage portal protein BeeE